MDKAPDAFRTISEVAEVLETPAHVLRFWESRFPQIKPVKRAGGRRYYRPSDVALLAGIRQLLHNEGMTIRGVQKVLREQGVRHVASLGGSLGDYAEDEDDVLETTPIIEAEPVPQMGTVVPLRRSADPDPAVLPDLAARPAPASNPAVPREGEGGFIAFSSPRSNRRSAESAQPFLPFDAPVDAANPADAAPAISAQDDTTLAATDEAGPLEQTLLPGAEDPMPSDDAGPGLDAEDMAPPDDTPLLDDLADIAGFDAPAAPPEPVTPDLSGLAERLRRLGNINPGAAPAWAELHSRLGLLHAQMVEAQRLRR